MKHSVLIIDDNLVDLELLSIVFGALNCEVDLAVDGNEALLLYEEKRHSVVVTDYKMEPIDGIDIAKRIILINPSVQFIIITGFPDDTVRDFTRDQNILDVVTKPFQVSRLIETLKDALSNDCAGLDCIDSHEFEDRMVECPILLGESESIRRVRKALTSLLMEKAPMLIEGADGVGKLEIARLLHKYGLCRRGSCVVFQCGNDLNREAGKDLFTQDGQWGEELERARGGTLVLGSIERLDPHATEQLIRNFKEMAACLRIIALEGCSTGLELEPVEMNRELYSRFNPNVVRLPALSERTEDLLPIMRAVAQSPIQYGLSRVLGDEEVEQIAQQLKFYDFRDNFLGLFQCIQKMADRS